MSDSWTHLREFTAARIALGRAGGSLPTTPLLDFRLSHARARDAVLLPFDPEALAENLRQLPAEVHTLHSRAASRAEYLQRPDLGRQLSDESRDLLLSLECEPPDLVVLVSDGLSSIAAMRQSSALLAALLPMLLADGWKIAPLFVVRHARVAIQDEAGALLNAKLSLIALGERPGLGSPDSLGAYFTYSPAPGRTDAERNCISNIRPEGLHPSVAAQKLHALLTASRRLQLSGIQLKDDTLLLPPAEPSAALK